MIFDLVVRGDRRDVGVADGAIVEVGPGLGPGREEVDAHGLLVLPGAVDAHVHLNDPGRADWEGFATGTRALAAGGVTCACDMPLNALPPTLDGASFDAKVAAARGHARIDFALWGGLVPGDLARLDELAERGVVGFKAFMCPSGVNEYPAADPDTLGRGMERAAALGLPVAVHAEDPAVIAPLERRARASGRLSMADWAASRPVEAELSAIRLALSLAEEAGCALHVVHVSSAAGVNLVAEARSRGLDATCEACPHHLALDEDDAARIGALAKCAPPLRSSAERRALWERVAAGAVDLVASDHSPGPPEAKTGEDMFAVWGGISGAQTTLPVLLTEGPAHGVAAARAAALLGAAPADRLRLAGKGRLRPGADADIALVRAEEWELRAADLEYRHRALAVRGPAARGPRRADHPARPDGVGRGRGPGGAPRRAPGDPGAGGRAVRGPHARTAVRRDHAVIAPESHVPGPVPGWSGAEHVQLIAPAMGARFGMALVTMGPGATAGPPAAGCGRALYVVEGSVALDAAGASRALGAGGYAYLPPGDGHALTATGSARVCVIDKPHAALAGAPPGRPVFGDAAGVAAEPLLGDPRVRVRALLPEEPALDLALNVMAFEPGAALGFVESHVMEHGLLVLEGSLVYRLADSWYPVAAGDAIWMAPYCPQWCCAYGDGPARYLIYKDWNRDVMG